MYSFLFACLFDFFHFGISCRLGQESVVGSFSLLSNILLAGYTTAVHCSSIYSCWTLEMFPVFNYNKKEKTNKQKNAVIGPLQICFHFYRGTIHR